MPRFADIYDLFVFDLDGTLADTREDLAESVNYALSRRGLPPLDVSTVTRYVGNGARVLVERALGPAASEETVELALRDFLSRYIERCTDRTVLYPGVRDTLERLRLGEGKKLAVLTNKPLAATRKILDAFGISGLFDRIEGGDSVPARKPDPAGLEDIARSLSADLARTLVVGDSAVDVDTARAAGAASAFVGYGFGPAPAACPPDHRLERVEELLGPSSPRARGR
mgnify:CR=1 FL=1